MSEQLEYPLADIQRMKFEERERGGTTMWHDFEAELQGLDDTKPLLLSPRQVQRIQWNVKVLRDDLKANYLKGADKHHGPEGCPTWYDGCNCTVETLESFMDDHETSYKLQLEVKDLKKEIVRLNEVIKEKSANLGAYLFLSLCAGILLGNFVFLWVQR